jgi:CheY-like chemotaxis protein
VPATAPVARAAEAAPARILVVEDEDAVRKVVGTLLRAVGHEVTEAADGEEAVRRFTATPAAFDLVVLDLVLPRLSGKEVLRRFRAVRPDVPVLLTSGNVHEGLEDPEVRAGIRGVLPKPYLPADLHAAVRAALAGT